MAEASVLLQFEKAGRLRDEISALKNLSLRGQVDKDVQPEVFQIEPKKGLAGLRKVLGLAQTPRTIEGVDIAHLGGETSLREVSVVGANYGLARRNLGSVGVMGPLRMDYATAISSVRGAASELSRFFETVYEE